MRLRQLFQNRQLPQDAPLRGLCDDSRRLRPGDLFCAYPGEAGDGRRHLAEAVAAGAAALAAEPPVAAPAGLPVVEVSGLRQRLGPLAARFYGQPSERLRLIAVTGTNGKTSCAHFMAQALAARGERCALVGTLGYGAPDCLQATELTTPGALELQRILAQLAAEGFTAVALEASSHGLAQGRLNGAGIDVAVLTNVTRDHLDYHGSHRAYRAAKASLFAMESLRGAVLNLDDELGAQLAQQLGQRGAQQQAQQQGGRRLQTVTYSRASRKADVHCVSLAFKETGLDLGLSVKGEEMALSSPLLGEFNAMNLLAVAACLQLLGLGRDELAACLTALKPVPGRMNLLRYPGLPRVIIDFAHTPDALEQCLTAVKRHFPGRQVSCVFGCGGDRDPGKRPLMGEVAARLADRTLLTSDNPRGEDPERILDDIEAGMAPRRPRQAGPRRAGQTGQAARPQRLADRQQAIETALREADADGVVVLAGKGHEAFQLVAGEKRPCSDFAAVAALAGQGRTHGEGGR